MKRAIKKLKRANLFSRIIFFIFSITYLITYIFFAKSMISLNGVETILRFLVLIFLIIYFIYYVLFSFAKLCKRKYKKFAFLSFITLIIIVIFILSSNIIDLFYAKIRGFRESDKVVYTSYLIGLNDTVINSKSSLGMIEDVDDIEGYILANEIINNNDLSQKVKYYDDYLSMLYDLYDDKIDGIFVSSNYVTLYGSEEKFSNIGSETKVIYQVSKEMKNSDSNLTNNKSLKDPFTVLIMGVDSEYDGLNANAAFNGDTLILASFNPHTLNATLFSIPRDTYVPIACRKGAKYKINSSAAYGTSCVISTIEDLTGISIDYYLKINFKGVVDLVEALDGIEVNVEEPNYNINHGHDCKQKFCEQDSDRRWGEHTIYLEPGYQTLNGEEALAYSRNRGQYAASDLARNRHQQEVILALAKKAVKINSYNKFKNVLDSISNNLATNMSTNQILSSYNIFKDMVSNMLSGDEFMGIQKTYLETYNLPVYLPHSGLTLSALGYYKSSLEAIIKEMKINLELEKPELITSFDYSLNEEYTGRVVGKGLRTGSTEKTIASFIGKTKTEADDYCNKNGLSCSFSYIDENSKYYDDEIDEDYISYQLPKPGSLLENDEVAFYIIGAKSID